ncbi:MAG: DUF4982 domain-containing protein [Salinivirgaceae bacterium]|jgi:beta-galactosidase|nr:DUF4982 domain-containing protein [Salinivirgaceae bacterium]
MNKLFLGLIISFLSFNVMAQKSTRLTNGWDYVKGDLGSPWEAFRPESQSKLPVWVPVNMPHCFNAFDAVDPDVAYYQGPGWYRNHIAITNPYENGRTILHFEGAGQKTDIYLLTKKIGSHVGGYDEFSIDISDAIQEYKQSSSLADSLIPIAIRCDNSRDAEMIPSDLSDFNVYGGLYRHVNLVYLPPVSLEQVQFNYKLDENFKKVDIVISAVLKNEMPSIADAQLELTISDAQGKVVSKYNTSKKTWKGELEIAKLSLSKPVLWHPENPYLYTLNVSVTVNGQTHNTTQKVGFNHTEFIKKGPLMVNGKRLLLRGTHRHEDHAGMAAAMTDNLIRQEMQMMKDIGINFIRLGHYQQSRLVLELCDSLGIFVWEEIPWCRGGLGGEVYKEQARRMLVNMIDQHQNHVSVLVWGLGNENDWPGDFTEFDEEKIRGFMSELNDLSHKKDPERLTAIRRCNFCKDIIDVYSPSIWAGWYRGKFTKYQEVSYEEAMDVDHFLHVEWGASHHAGRHSENPDKGLVSIIEGDADERAGDFLMSGGDPRVSKDGDWSETYACNLIDWHLKEQENMEWLTGTAYWPFKDFSTPLRPENPVPYVNQKGVVQRDLTPKESYYVFQSYWTSKPMAHIYGHTWETRWGKKGEDKLIKVYSNCSEAELFFNGESLGKRTRNSQDYPAAGLRWKVQFKEGENHLKVIAKQGKVEVVDEITQVYQTAEWGAESELKIEEVLREGNVLTVCAKVYDKNGVYCADSKEMVEFETAGNAELIDDLGTWDGSRKIQLYNGRAFMKIILKKGNAIISVKSAKVKATFLKVEL